MTVKSKIVFGIKQQKPFIDPPPGKIRVKMRNDNFAQAFVKNGESIRHFFIRENGLRWELCYEQGSNTTIK